VRVIVAVVRGMMMITALLGVIVVGVQAVTADIIVVFQCHSGGADLTD
jgi:hypothetical protein